MRKSGFAAAAGLGSLALLLTACGGSSGSSSTSAPATTSTAQPAGQASSGALSNVPPGSTVLHVQKSAIGYVLALANGQVVYMYDKDTKGSASACTGSCASLWLPVTGNPVVSPADTGFAPLSTVTGVGGQWHVIKMSESNIVTG
jgi:predicted lipoprotein with Yx(FWY)xxD motif